MNSTCGTGEKRVTRQIVLPAILALLTAAVVIAALLFWSVARTDSVAASRQQQLVLHALDQSIAKLNSEQETTTIFEPGVPFFNSPEWRADVPPGQMLADADEHYGLFFHRLFGHDEVYVLGSDDRPLYAMREGRRADRLDYRLIADIADPVVARLRATMRRTRLGPIGRNSPGVADIAMLNGHLAILSAKPIVSPTGHNPNEPGREAVAISIQRLDSEFVGYLADRLLLHGARFSASDNHGADEASAPFVSPLSQRVVGHLIWQPYTPGSIVRRDMALPLLAGLFVVFGVTWLLIRRIRRSTAELHASEAQARHLAFHDVLTGLPNRALFDDRLDRALAAVRRHQDEYVALICLDLDRFKRVNDTLGHPAGDELIREVARRLTNVIRASDTVARLGGDEFAIIQTGVHSEDDIKLLCDRIIEAIEQPFDLVGSQVFVGVSIGVARSGIDAVDRTELSRKADIALYDAKASGRGRYSIFAEMLDATIQTRRTIEAELRTALSAGDQLRVWYQPKYAAGSREVAGVEALVRWQHPTKGFLAPAMFVPIAEESGLIDALGEWVLAQACAAGAHWDVEAISVNVSAVQLRNPFFAHQVLKILEETGLPPARLELEITETSFMDSVELCVPNLKLLRSVGVRIALDDFGTGYSSFTHLRSFEVDRIKIDKSFTFAIGSSDDSNAIIQAIVDLAHSTGIRITAEGVETNQQRKFLCAVGCDELQGFLLSHPLPLDDIDRLLGIDPAVRRPPAYPAVAA